MPETTASDGVQYGGTKTWLNGQIFAKVYYSNSTLVIDITNNSNKRVGITSIKALGRMIRVSRTNEIIKEHSEILRDNQVVYEAKYINESRNGEGGAGNEASEIESEPCPPIQQVSSLATVSHD